MRSEAIVNIIGVVVSGGAVNPPKGNRKGESELWPAPLD